MNTEREREMKQAQALLCNNIKSLRESNKYSQKYVAEYLGIDRTTYTYYELQRTCPNILTLTKLSKLYNISIDELLTRKL